MNGWLPQYLAGVVLFSAGMGWAVGLPGILIAMGSTMMLGAFGHFLLSKIAALPPATPSIDGDGQ